MAKETKPIVSFEETLWLHNITVCIIGDTV